MLKKAQEQYAKFYNSKAVDKSFQDGEQVIVLGKDSNSKTFARLADWKNLPNIVTVYLHMHANKLRKLVVPVTHIGIISENDADFGMVLDVPPEKVDINCLPSQRIDLNSLSHLSEE